MEPPAYLTSLKNNIRARPISWEGAMRAKTITEDNLKKIKAIDKVRKEQRRQIVEDDLDNYVTLLIGDGNIPSIFESTTKRTDIVQYMLVLLGELIDDIPSLVQNIVKRQNPYSPFLPLLQQSTNIEDPIPLLASSVLSQLLSTSISTQSKQSDQIDKALSALYDYLSKLSKSSDAGLQDIGVQEYSTVLRSKSSRQLLWNERNKTIDPLIEILRNAAVGKDTDSTLRNGSMTIRSISDNNNNSHNLVGGAGNGGVGLQLLYHVLLVIWQLSFEGKLVGPGLDEKYDIIPLYTSLLRLSPKEKTTRLLLSTLLNLLSTNNPSLFPAAISCRLPELLRNLSTRHFNDVDLIADLSALTKLVEEYSQKQSTFDAYAAEINSGHLRWSAVHRNEAFWKENSKRIVEENKGELIIKLNDIMSKDWEQDRSVLAVGCNDIAWLVKFCPEKKRFLEEKGLKGRVMALMGVGGEEEEGVRYEALKAVGGWLSYSIDT